MNLPEETLYEIRNVQQVPGEPRRRWYFSHEMDLIVWSDAADQPLFFQLSYDKHRIERIVRWKSANGFTHWLANDRATDEDAWWGSQGAGFMVPDGPFDARRVRARFLTLSGAMPWNITEFVANQLRRHRTYRSKSDGWEIVALVSLLAVSMALLIGRTRPKDRHD